MKYFGKTYHPPGTAPGTLIGDEKTRPEKIAIHLIDFIGDDLIEQQLISTEECQPYLEKDSISWIHLQGPIHADTIRNLGNIFKLHPLALEDTLNTGQRPKMDEYDDLLFVVMAMPSEINGETTIEQVSLFLGQNYLISFHSGKADPFEPLRNRIRKANSPIRQHQADFLLYSILDLIIDQGYPLLESLGEEIETIEEALLIAPTKQQTLAEVHRLRRELLLLRRNLWPQREVINKITRAHSPLISDNTLLYLRDCYDHTIQIMELIENYREMATSLIDVYLSSSSYRLNEIMRVLTMIATVFIPLTFIVGLYGMNFAHPDSPWAMPELHWYYGYPFAWAVMISVIAGMLLYFRHKDWL